jgi:beta-mannosidase
MPVPEELEPVGPKEFLVADADGLRALYFPVPDREVPYPRPRFDVTVAPGEVTVTAHTLVRDLLLQADRLAPTASTDRGLVTLLPGERVTMAVRGWETRGDAAAAAARAALYCVEPTR